METIALYNLKGGVGKTAGCVNLAYHAAADEKKVLVWDLDPQGSATYYFQVTPKLKGGFKKMLSGEATLEDNIRATEYIYIDLIPAEFGNRNLDALLEAQKQSKKKLTQLIGQLESQYDYLFLDCPPGLGSLSEAIIAAADVVLLPTIPTTLSIRTFEIVQGYFNDHQLLPEKLRSFFSMVDGRKTLHNEVLAQYSKNKHFLKSYIPYLSTIEKMGTQLSPVGEFAPGSYAAICYHQLWKELQKNIPH